MEKQNNYIIKIWDAAYDGDIETFKKLSEYLIANAKTEEDVRDFADIKATFNHWKLFHNSEEAREMLSEIATEIKAKERIIVKSAGANTL